VTGFVAVGRVVVGGTVVVLDRGAVAALVVAVSSPPAPLHAANTTTARSGQCIRITAPLPAL
jgi:hypothetical protein